MKKILRNSAYYLLAAMLGPIQALAQGGGSVNTGDGTSGASENLEIDFKIENPIAVNNIGDFIKELLDIVLTIGIPIVALAIIYSGFLFVQARGSEEGLTKAKQSLTYTLIGAALLLGSWVLAQAISGTIDQLR